ncbi:MAG: hypothetical protein AB8F78_09100 [Saprospiraceae bacterium]
MKFLLYLAIICTTCACTHGEEIFEIDCDLTFDSITPTFNIESYAQLRLQTIDTLQVLEKYTNIPGAATGIPGTPSTHYETTRWFQKHINQEEANVLRLHPNTFIQALAIKRLYYSKDSHFFDHLIEAFHNPTEVEVSSGCITSRIPMFQHYLSTIHYPRLLETNHLEWTHDQLSLLDSLAMTTGDSTFYRINKD